MYDRNSKLFRHYKANLYDANSLFAIFITTTMACDAGSLTHNLDIVVNYGMRLFKNETLE